MCHFCCCHLQIVDFLLRSVQAVVGKKSSGVISCKCLSAVWCLEGFAGSLGSYCVTDRGFLSCPFFSSPLGICAVLLFPCVPLNRFTCVMCRTCNTCKQLFSVNCHHPTKIIKAQLSKVVGTRGKARSYRVCAGKFRVRDQLALLECIVRVQKKLQPPCQGRSLIILSDAVIPVSIENQQRNG